MPGNPWLIPRATCTRPNSRRACREERADVIRKRAFQNRKTPGGKTKTYCGGVIIIVFGVKKKKRVFLEKVSPTAERRAGGGHRAVKDEMNRTRRPRRLFIRRQTRRKRYGPAADGPGWPGGSRRVWDWPRRETDKRWSARVYSAGERESARECRWWCTVVACGRRKHGAARGLRGPPRMTLNRTGHG